MRCLLLIVLALLVVAVPATADGATITRKKSMWGPAFKDGVSQFPIYADLGVGIWQTIVQWDAAAPTRPANPRDPSDPAYQWPAELDGAIAEATRHGITTSVAVLFTPGWANGGKDRRWVPDKTQDFADFMEAIVRRYPAVRSWLIWIEPTKSQNFQPLDEDQNRTLKGFRRRGPQAYAKLLDAAYVAVNRVDPSDLVIGGNTFTLGTIRARWYLPALRLPNGKPPRMDLYGHNPFSLREPDLKKPDTPGNYADFSDLDTLAKWVDRYLGRSRVTGKPLKFFLSEYSLPTDHANFEFNFFVNRRTQAKWLTSALKIARRWTRIYTFGYLGLYDDPELPDGTQVERGLITREGVRKPGYDAFRRG